MIRSISQRFHSPRFHSPFAAMGLMLACGVTSFARDGQVELPSDPQVWLNSQPWSMEQLSGKAAVLFFFEEDCPKCRGRWPQLNLLAQSHAEDPVLFIAVTSGTDRDAMQNYVQQNQINWTVLLDPDRSFEKACDVGTISVQNIMQVAIIGPDGTLRRGDWQDLEATTKTALNGAAWTVDPKIIPGPLKPAWQQVEFHNYLAAAPAIRKALKSPKEETKTAAEALLAVVQPHIDAKAATADTAYEAGEKWTALRNYQELTEQFKGYELPDTVEARKKELQSDPSIKGEIAAMKAYQAAMKFIDNPKQQKKGIAALKKLVKDKPDTEAGKKAQEQLDKHES